MKRAWIAGAVLSLLFACTLWSGLRLERFTGDLADSLHRAQSYAQTGDWDAAGRTTEGAFRRFRERAFSLHITLRHSDIDAAETAFQEVEQLLAHRERLGEYAAANARLIAQLELLAESERFSLHNIL